MGITHVVGFSFPASSPAPGRVGKGGLGLNGGSGCQEPESHTTKAFAQNCLVSPGQAEEGVMVPARGTGEEEKGEQLGNGDWAPFWGGEMFCN